MLTIVIDGILPVAVLISVGFGLGKRGVFSEAATSALAKMVVSVALPVDLFLGAIATPRSQIAAPKYIAAVAIALVGLYIVTFWIGRDVFRHNTSDSAVEAMTVGFPAMGFVGLPILVAAVGKSAGTLPILIGNVVTLVVIMPVTVAVLARNTASPRKRSGGAIVIEAVKPPLVWLPILGVVLALLGVNHLPVVVDNILSPLGAAASGVALVTVGLMLSYQPLKLDLNVTVNTVLKVVVMPLVMLALVSVFGIRGDAHRALLLLAVTPTASAVGMLSLRYRTYVSEVAPTIVWTTVLGFCGYLVVLALT
jgi:malonate transporter and related proteins